MKKFFDNYDIDYFVDASDWIVSKVHLMKECLDRGIKVISSMGAANRTIPTRFTIWDILKHIPIQWPKLRSKLKKLGIRKGIPVVFWWKRAIVVRRCKRYSWR